MRYLIIVLSILSATVLGQQPRMAVFFNNAATDSMGNYTFTSSGITYSSATYEEPTHSVVFGDGLQHHVTATSTTNLNTGSGYAISMWFKTSKTSGYPYLFTFGINELKAYMDCANRNIHFRDAYGDNDALTGNAVYTYGEWTHVVFIKYNEDLGYGRIFINGTDQTSDSVMSDPISLTGTLTMGNFTPTSYSSFGGNIDNFQYYDYALSDSQIDSLYDNGATNFILYDEGTPPVGYNPTQYVLNRGGVQYIPYYNGAAYDPTYSYVAPTPEYDDTTVVQMLGRGANAYGVVSNSNLVPNYTKTEWDGLAEHFNHVRLVLYGFADNGAGNVINESVLGYLTDMVDSCVSRGMVALIDYHSPAWTVSYTSDNINEYLSHWTQIASTLSSYDTTEVVYELVNEPHYDLTLTQWNDLAARAVDSIRAYDTDKYIMLSPGYWAGVKGLPYLVLPDDDRLIVSLHYYDPRTLTHQCAAWGLELPGGGYLSETWCGTPWYAIQPFMDVIIGDFAYVDEFRAANNNVPIHIGEFGVYTLADDTTARAPYFNFLSRWFESKGWSWCIWDFDADFGVFTDGDYMEEVEQALFVDPYPTPVAFDSTVIYQSNFASSTDNWGCFDSDGTTPTAEASLSYSGGELVVTVNTPGSSTTDIRIGHTVDLVQGKIYRLSYTIRSASNRNYLLAKAGTRMFYREEYNVDNSGTTRVYSQYYSDVDHYSAKITFDIGGSSSTFYISNVTWEELTIVDPLADFEILEYWNFEDQTLGQFTEAEIESYFSGSTAYIDSGHEDKLNIVTESMNGDVSNKALQLTYPAETYSQLYFWDYPLNNGSGYSDIWISMDIKYGDDDLTNWSSSGGGKNFGIKGTPWNFLLEEPGEDEGFYVVPQFLMGGQLSHYYYNHWPTGYGNNINYPSFGTNTNYFLPGVWYKLTIHAEMNSSAANSDGIIEIFYNDIPIYQYSNYRFYEDATLMNNLIDILEFTYFQGGASDEYRQDEDTHVYWDNIVLWTPETPIVGLVEGTLDVPYPITGETYQYQTLITTEQTFTNSEYGSNYSEQVTEAWLIDAGAGNTVTLTVNAMDLDNSTTVQYDIVKIYDGNVAGSTLIGRHGSALTTNFPTVGNSCSSTGRYMYVIFESDRNGQVGTGFQMTVTFN
jgi:hypothetical protein